MYTYEYQRPSFTADCIIFTPNHEVLLITRGKDPFAGKFAFPGGFVNIDELTHDAAYRELEEETSLTRENVYLGYLDFYEGIDRDPRGRVISFVYFGIIDSDKKHLVKAGDDAVDHKWVNVFSLNEDDLAFDHFEILRWAVRRMFDRTL